MRPSHEGPRDSPRDSTSPPNHRPQVSLVRPYLLTAGRAEPTEQLIEIESQVLSTDQGLASLGELTYEHRDIVALCRVTLAVAEIAARLGMHIGVARVLVADLATLGHVVVQRPGSSTPQDTAIIERVIRGLQAIR